MNIAVVTSSPPAVEGGHLVIARALANAIRGVGHDAHLVTTPDYGFGRLTASYLAAYRTGVSAIDGRPVDQVISLRYPSFAVRHPRHVCWLNHTMREYYDLWPQFAASLSWRNRLKEGVRRRTLHAVDGHLLSRHVTRVVAQSKTIKARLARDFGLDVEVVYPPAPLHGYRCDDYGDYVFSVSRLDPLKRVDLLIRALAEPPARHVRAVIAGDGADAPRLKALAATLAVADRVQFAGRIDDDAMMAHLARCRAVYFAPFAEDYGFVTIEAFASSKAVITADDSGGPAELVRDDATGVVCKPASASIATAVARLIDDEPLARRLGAAAAKRAAELTWPDTVNRLLR